MNIIYFEQFTILYYHYHKIKSLNNSERPSYIKKNGETKSQEISRNGTHFLGTKLEISTIACLWKSRRTNGQRKLPSSLCDQKCFVHFRVL